jgi:transcription-repair coupling factor (superfamily II helicase)
VVHIDHGIGVFRGLRSLGVDADEREFVALEYKDGAKLYVPVDRLDLIQKYAAGGDAKPRVDRLGGASWTKTKSRIRKSMRKLAEELLKLYARREIASGHAFPEDDEFFREFEKTFQYEETPDQISAIEETKRDMESERPMDRLVCGDVGYGKTEVAMRAAFKAVNGGKQVALLTPTTVLAFQHFNTFAERFEGFPVNISMLSRFLTRDRQKEVLKNTSGGLTDILIGTHRILSKDVRFKDLGLIVVDEEQRFGVAQKEKLKSLKAQVDVLALSATPIPRTLNMSLIGIRDLSIIETPPRDRLAIQTSVTKFSRNTIRSAIDLELKRSGQTFFVHNSIETIYSIAEMVQKVVPEARVAVAHGQMKENQLEKIMLDFLEYRFDVLVCTTIIENGLDIPRANTIIVNRADHFGLSQLYQLRGRVGRSDRRAYAYLMIPSGDSLSPTARKRLAAIKEFSELGSGFRLAAMDLEIRGAGNLLGGEQHGHIRTVGYELYVKLLEQTIRELKGEKVPEEIRSSIDLRMDIQIPEHYVEDPNLRLWLYKRVSTAADETSIEQFREEMTDRFGKYPRSVSNLMEYARLRLKSQVLRITSLERKASEVVLRFREDTPLIAERVISMAQERDDLAFSPSGDLILTTSFSEPNALFDHLNELLDKMSYVDEN